MKDSNILISFAIPTYNGQKTIKSTLESIVSQIKLLPKLIQKKIEIVIIDDNSNDDTLKILNTFQNKDFINIFINEKNLGMDLNFRNVAVKSKGEYVWFFGQDDILETGGLLKVYEILHEYKPNILSLNYSQYDYVGKKIDASCLKNIVKGVLRNDFIYNYQSSEEYFTKFYSPPTFLPATVMKRVFWDKFDPAPFIGTCYVQVACIFENLHNGKIVVCTNNFIKGLVPDDKWQSNGNELFKVMFGSLKMQHIVYNLPNNYLPKNIFNNSKRNFLFRLYFLMGNSINKGYQVNESDLKELLQIYTNKIEIVYIKFLFKLNYGKIFSIVNWFKLNLLKPAKKLFLFLQ